MGYAATTLGIFFFILSYFILNAPPDATKKPSTTSAKTNFCQLADPASAPTFQAPADYANKAGLGAPEGSRDIVNNCDKNDSDDRIRHRFSPTLTTYKLLRKNVPLSTTDVNDNNENFTGNSCHFSSADQVQINIPEVDRTKYKVFFPQLSGEISLNREIPSRTRGKNSDLLYFIDYGLVFLLHLNPDGSFVEYQGGTSAGQAETFYLADIYQDVGSGRPDLPPDAFQCDSVTTGVIGGNQQVFKPNQSVSTTQDQLQLQYFVINSDQVVNGWGIHCKPAIYLYPPKKQLVNVKVYPSGFLTYTDPPYPQDTGWTVEANPNGSLSTLDNSPFANNYLYFESKIKDEVIEKPTRGWVIKSGASGKDEGESWFDPLKNHFQETLPKLGLNQEQTNEFIGYWKKTLPYSPYYFVGIIDQENVNEIEKLEITPKPDYLNRVRVYFERLDRPKTVTEPDISSFGASNFEFDASTFKVVEWGGMVKNDPNHPFTCSQ